MEISSEAWPDIYNEGYRHQLQAEPNHKAVAGAPSLKMSSFGASLKWSQKPSQLTKE